MSDQIVVVLTVVVMLIGLAGVIVPIVPGVLLVGAAAIVSTFVLGISAAGWLMVATVALIAIGGAGASIALPARKGVTGGAGRGSLVLATAFGVVGFFAIPVVGLPIGALGGLYLGELNRLGDRREAWVTTRQVLRAYGIGVLVEFGAALLIIVIWLPGAVLRLT